MPDYSDLTKDELVAEITKRRNDGSDISVNIRGNKDELISALELDDVENGGGDEITPSDVSLQAQARADGVTLREVPDDLDQYKGQYKYLATGEVFGLKVLGADEVRANRTHQLKSPLKFWDGTAAEFREQFDKL